MKILQINAVYGFASTGRTCSEMTEVLLSWGHKVCTLSTANHGIAENNLLIGTKLDRKIHAYMSRIFGLQGYFSRASTRKMIRFIDDYKPDIVHLRNLHGNYINLKMLLGYLAKKDIATVVTLHDCWFYTGKCTHYTLDKCMKWQSGCNNCPRLKKDNQSWFFDRTGKMLNDKYKYFSKIPRLAVVGVSKWITDEARRSILKNADIIDSIYNWIDIEKFKKYDDADTLRGKYGLEDKYIIISVAAKWGNGKGLDKFIELSQKLESDEVIVLVGTMPDDIVLPSNVIAVGRTDSTEELAKWYCTSDVCISLSKEESFGKTVAEAQACGTPAIVFNSTALPELVGDDCGAVIENEGELCDAIAKIKKNGKDYYSSRCIKNVCDNFDMVTNVNRYVDIYRKLLQMKDV